MVRSRKPISIALDLMSLELTVISSGIDVSGAMDAMPPTPGFGILTSKL
jgi:hypothetical protein